MIEERRDVVEVSVASSHTLCVHASCNVNTMIVR